MEFPNPSDQKRYHSLYHYNKTRYGARVMKASLDAGCTCPNRDGTKGSGGCTFCQGLSHYFAGSGDISGQLEREIARIHGKYPESKVIAYFQAGTNTYGPLMELEKGWQTALKYREVCGLSIATRCDCLEEPVLDALSRLSEQTDLTVELGLQTIHDETAARIHRGHSFKEFLGGYEQLRRRNIRTCVHLINGLPGETTADMLESARVLGQLRPGGVKIHLLHVTENTELAELWRKEAYIPMEKQDYIDITASQIRLFSPETVMERLTGDGDRRYLLAPMWSRDKISVLGGIDHRLRLWNAVQGDRIQ